MLVMEELLTPKQIAEALHISVYKVKVMLRVGTIKGVKVDGQWRVRPADYRRYIDSLGSPESEKDTN